MTLPSESHANIGRPEKIARSCGRLTRSPVVRALDHSTSTHQAPWRHSPHITRDEAISPPNPNPTREDAMYPRSLRCALVLANAMFLPGCESLYLHNDANADAAQKAQTAMNDFS